jgi:hypothetical protein
MSTPKQRTACAFLRILRESGPIVAADIARAIAINGNIQEFLAEVRENRPATESPYTQKTP